MQIGELLNSLGHLTMTRIDNKHAWTMDDMSHTRARARHARTGAPRAARRLARVTLSRVSAGPGWTVAVAVDSRRAPKHA